MFSEELCFNATVSFTMAAAGLELKLTVAVAREEQRIFQLTRLRHGTVEHGQLQLHRQSLTMTR